MLRDTGSFTKTCVECGDSFVTRQSKQICCSTRCSVARQVKMTKALNEKNRSERRKIYPRTRKCSRCKKNFAAKQANHIYCSTICRTAVYLEECEKNWKPPKYPKQATCSYCKEQFISTSPKNIYCSDDCRGAVARAKGKFSYSKSDLVDGDPVLGIRGHYVYGWYSPKDPSHLPFYIGMGTGIRGWIRHPGQNCGKYRNEKTKVVVFRSNLTIEGAMLLEAVLIDLFKSMGADLTNVAEPMRRREIPPLEHPS